MNTYLVGYMCIYSALVGERKITVEASSKKEAIEEAIAEKRNHSRPESSRVEYGAIDWDSFRVIKKLQGAKLSRDEVAVAGDLCEARGDPKTKANLRRVIKELK
jgi:hypothetical protein